ncbi:hypothetical protein BX666DRAFT_1985841 [Dichotomocladium elegans]|nr:hypothetical protein BX666DRAFT_1985841 [Dichotomocladium elegans]
MPAVKATFSKFLARITCYGHQPSGSRFGYAFPHEVLLEIFSYLKDCQSTMYAVSLVCRQWMLCIAPLLYRHARIADTYRWATFILTLTRDKKTFCYGNFVTVLDLVATSSVRYISDFQNTLITSTEQGTANDSSTATTENHIEGDIFAVVSSSGLLNCNARETKDIPVLVTTSSLMQMARTCRNLTSINLSLTTIMYDRRIEETGEYVSTLQHHAVPSGLTQTLIPMEVVIQALGTECERLTEVVVQRCEWVTAHIIWLWTSHCHKLVRLDAFRCAKCTVKSLTTRPLVLEPEEDFYEEEVMEGESDEEATQEHDNPSTLPRWLLVSKVPGRERYRSLKQVVYDRLKDAKTAGASDLEWFQI